MSSDEILTIMLRGAAKTVTEKATQIPPRILTRIAPFGKKWLRVRRKQNPPKFNTKKSLNVKT